MAARPNSRVPLNATKMASSAKACASRSASCAAQAASTSSSSAMIAFFARSSGVWPWCTGMFQRASGWLVMPSSSAIAATGRRSAAAARFSCRCAIEDVPAISRMLGARLQQPRQRDLARGCPEVLRHAVECRQVERAEAA